MLIAVLQVCVMVWMNIVGDFVLYFIRSIIVNVMKVLDGITFEVTDAAPYISFCFCR